MTLVCQKGGIFFVAKKSAARRLREAFAKKLRIASVIATSLRRPGGEGGPTMKSLITIVGLFVMSAPAACALSDRSAIEILMTELELAATSAGTKPISEIYTDESGVESARLTKLFDRLRSLSRRPFSEMTPPHLSLESIMFVTPEVAMVDAVVAQYGSTVLVSKVPVFIVVKKIGSHWKVALVRIAAFGSYGAPLPGRVRADLPAPRFSAREPGPTEPSNVQTEACPA
jgi:hypothetical protein